MIKNINDKFREYVASNIDSSAFDLFSKMNFVQLDHSISIMLSDYYKIYFMEIIPYSKEKLELFNKSIYSIKRECLYNPATFFDLVYATLFFNNIDLITKSIVMDELNKKSKNSYLSEINPLHTLDMISYTFNYDLDSFKEYYIDAYNKVDIDKEQEEKLNHFFVSKLKKLKVNDLTEYKKFILEFLKYYYKYGIYEKNIEDRYIKLIKNFPMPVIFKRLDRDDIFLTTIINSYLKKSTTETNKLKEEVNNFFYNNTDVEIQKKLKM